MDRGAWGAAVHRVTKSRTRLGTWARTHTHTHTHEKRSESATPKRVCDFKRLCGHLKVLK